jgi:trimethylamine:corrinoid methyltransferase-like protein
MTEVAGIRDLIQAAAEGAAGGLTALRSGGIPAVLGGFSVEIDFESGEPARPTGTAALVRITLAVSDGRNGGPAEIESPGLPDVG